MQCKKKSHEGTFYLCHCVTLLFVIELTLEGKGRKEEKYVYQHKLPKRRCSNKGVNEKKSKGVRMCFGEKGWDSQGAFNALETD